MAESDLPSRRTCFNCDLVVTFNTAISDVFDGICTFLCEAFPSSLHTTYRLNRSTTTLGLVFKFGSSHSMNQTKPSLAVARFHLAHQRSLILGGGMVLVTGVVGCLTRCFKSGATASHPSAARVFRCTIINQKKVPDCRDSGREEL